jgi:hypothetical protein
MAPRQNEESEHTMTNLVTLLACLSMIESGDDDLKVGKAGETSRWQISVLERKRFGPADYQDKFIAGTITAYLIAERTDHFFLKHRKDPTPFETYVLWNAPAQIGHPSKVVAEKAQRFENLVKAKMNEK